MSTDSAHDSDSTEIFVFCKICKRNIGILVDVTKLRAISTVITPLVSMHGEPPHAIMVYLDRNLTVRGIEYPYAIVAEGEDAIAEEKAAPELPASANINLPELLDSFGLGKKENVKVLGNLLMQILLSNPVYLIHDDPDTGSKILRRISDLFTNQDLALHTIPHIQIPSIKDRQPCIYDLQERKYIYEGMKIDIHRFENMVKESLDDKDGSFKLKNELSKIYYAYEKLKEILRVSDAKLKETQLAKHIGIEMALMPPLLKMAESEEIDIKSKVESDGLARALRSI